eukprot:COSAG04_NODE_24590_length_319_cov_1.309091_1_plen_39_part_10
MSELVTIGMLIRRMSSRLRAASTATEKACMRRLYHNNRL